MSLIAVPKYRPPTKNAGPSRLQITALKLMALLVFLTFLVANLQTMLWVTSDWLVSSILPAVVVDLTNDERAEDDLPPLQRSSLLDLAATKKAEHMATHEYFSHYSPDGVSPWHWFGQVSYNFAHAGENLAVYFTDSREMVDAWMNSPTHRANIVDGRFTQIGVGTAKGEYEGYDTVYVVQLFGTPAESRLLPISPPAVTEPKVTVATNNPTKTSLPATTDINEEEITTNENLPDDLPVFAEEPELEEGMSELVQTDEAEEIAVNEEVNEEVDEVQSDNPEEWSEEINQPITEDTLASVDTEMVEIVSIQSSLISTSSGLTPAPTTLVGNVGGSQSNVLGMAATSPQLIIQITYSLLSLLIVGLLGYSVFTEWRLHHVRQVAYGFLLCMVMLCLFGLHIYATNTGMIV